MEGTRAGPRVILFPLPFQGHINPMIQLATILYTKGFHISIVHTSFNSPDSSKNPQFTFHSLPLYLSEAEACTDDIPALLQLMNLKCFDLLREKLAELLSDRTEAFTCLISDAYWHFAQEVADNLKIPRIVLQTGSICSFLPVIWWPALQKKGLFQLPEDEPVSELPPFKVKDLPLIQTRDEDVCTLLIGSIARSARRSLGIIFNSCKELEEEPLIQVQSEFQVPTFLIGPFHKIFPASSSSLIQHDESCISWLDKQEQDSVLYVSLGSLMTIQESEFLEIAWGLRNSGQPFLWVVRPGSIDGSTWLEPLPHGFMAGLNGRGHIVKWAPQHEVLAHPATGGFLTHCGWNSTLESICEGVPMICKPCLGDQIQNARYVTDIWRTGFHLEFKIERLVIEKTIRKLMRENEGDEVRARSRAWKEKINLCLMEKGSSYQQLEELISYMSSI